jgi:hypothetical protein
MPQYILRDLPEGLWRRVKARAARDGWPLRALILQLLEDFAGERITPSGPAPMLVGSPPPAPAPSRHVAFIRLVGMHPETRLDDAVRGFEKDGFLCLFDDVGNQLARFHLSDIRSWRIEEIR